MTYLNLFDDLELATLHKLRSQVERAIAAKSSELPSRIGIAAQVADAFEAEVSATASQEQVSGQTQDPPPIADETQAPLFETEVAELVEVVASADPAEIIPILCQGPWSRAEDLVLLECFVEGTIDGEPVGQLLAPVMAHLGRGQTDCMDRFAELVVGPQTDRAMREVLRRTREVAE